MNVLPYIVSLIMLNNVQNYLLPVNSLEASLRQSFTSVSLFHRSHCTCDKALYQCLKAANHPTANLMGQIYFNLIKVPCIEDTKRNRYSSSELARTFVPVKRGY